MRIHVLTDIHLEFQKWRKQWPIETIDCDAHVLAGDIGGGLTGLDFALERFNKPLIYIAGNHEFYNKRPVEKWWKDAREKVAGTHVHLLENEQVVIGNTRLLGCTLWTDFTLFGEDRQQELGKHAEKESNDFKNIFLTRRGGISYAQDDPYSFGFTRKRSGDRWTWKTMAATHVRSREFLETELDRTGDWDQTVVVTHHAPSIKGIEDPDTPSDLDAAYASNLDHLIMKADCWIHGHVHRAREYSGTLGGRVVENARGYADSPNSPDSVPGFKWDRVIEVLPKPVAERKISCP